MRTFYAVMAKGGEYPLYMRDSRHLLVYGDLSSANKVVDEFEPANDRVALEVCEVEIKVTGRGARQLVGNIYRDEYAVRDSNGGIVGTARTKETAELMTRIFNEPSNYKETV